MKSRPPYRRSHLACYSDLVLRSIGDKDLVTQFFTAFSRFEYALKTSGFAKRDHRAAKPDWDHFVESFSGHFDPTADPHLEEAVNYLTSSPPRRQVLEGQTLQWEDTPRRENEDLLAYIVRLVKTVRNNLFHGAKFGSSVDSDDRHRNERLLASALEVLYFLLDCHEEVRHSFWGELFYVEGSL